MTETKIAKTRGRKNQRPADSVNTGVALSDELRWRVKEKLAANRDNRSLSRLINDLLRIWVTNQP